MQNYTLGRVLSFQQCWASALLQTKLSSVVLVPGVRTHQAAFVQAHIEKTIVGVSLKSEAGVPRLRSRSTERRISFFV